MPHEPRLRDYLTRDEVASLLRAAKKSPRQRGTPQTLAPISVMRNSNY
jgi:hypothetical protein